LRRFLDDRFPVPALLTIADNASTDATLPLVEDPGWFFDTEVLALAERNGLRIHEVPVDWVDDPDSRVDVVATALADLRGIWRLRVTGTTNSDGSITASSIREGSLGFGPEGRPAGVAGGDAPGAPVA
jgi:hypothetical protein